MSPNNASLTASNAGSRDDELFTAPSSDPTPDRHPSILRPGGHASPLKYPAVLRPGAARRSRTPSPNPDGASTSPAHPPQASPPPVTYKAYSPSRPQSPSDELATEIEGYFTALEVPPLTINKPQPTFSNPPLSAEQRCTSPPVPPKELLPIDIERHVVSPMSELEAPTGTGEENHQVVSPTSAPEIHTEEVNEAPEPPPAYDESQRVTPPPEKSTSPHRISDESLAGAAASSAAQIGGAMAGVSTDEAVVGPTDVTTTESDAPGAPTEAHSGRDDGVTAAPPPLPPRPTPSSTKGKEPAMPGAFPAPPAPPAPTVSPSYKTSGAAATSAASVGAAVAGVGQSASLKQARKALGHMIDKAKEHHHAREQQRHERKPSRKTSPEDGKKKKSANPGPIAEVSSN